MSSASIHSRITPSTRSAYSEPAQQHLPSSTNSPMESPAESELSQSPSWATAVGRPIMLPDTPAATPESLVMGRSNSSSSSGPDLSVRHRPVAAARSFLVDLFPGLATRLRERAPAKEDPYVAEDAGVELVEHCAGWRGAVLDRSRGNQEPELRTLYVLMPTAMRRDRERADAVNGTPAVLWSPQVLRSSVLALLDFASDALHPPCGSLVLAIDRAQLPESELPSLLHGLCYVGGTVVNLGRKGHAAEIEEGSGERPRDDLVLVRIEL